MEENTTENMNDESIMDMMDEKQEGEKKRGGPRGKRPIVWICVGMMNSELKTESFISTNYVTDDDSIFTDAFVSKLFTDKFGVTPAKIFGPFYKQKGNNRTLDIEDSNNNSPIKMEDLQFSGERKKAIHDGWNGIANLITNDKSYVYFISLQDIDESIRKRKRSIPAPKIVHISSVKYME